MHHFCWSHACSSSETVSRNTVFCRRFLVIFICFCLVVCFLAYSILISFTLGNKEMSEAEFQENADYPKQASPRHKLLCKADVFLPNSDQPPFGTLGARLGKKIESACR